MDNGDETLNPEAVPVSAPEAEAEPVDLAAEPAPEPPAIDPAPAAVVEPSSVAAETEATPVAPVDEPVAVLPDPDDLVRARRVPGWGSVNLHGHAGAINEGDMIEMRRQEAEGRPDFEVVND